MSSDLESPDYQLSYIERTVQTLSNIGLTITPVDVLSGMWMINARGLKGRDAETALLAFLKRLAPTWEQLAVNHCAHFIGWPALKKELQGVSNEDLFARFGGDCVRVAAVVRE